MTDITTRDRKIKIHRRAGVVRNTNARSVFAADTHRPVPRSGYCSSIMSFYDGGHPRTGRRARYDAPTPIMLP